MAVVWAFVKSSSWAEQRVGTYAIVRQHTRQLGSVSGDHPQWVRQASSNGIFSRLLIVLEVFVGFH